MIERNGVAWRRDRGVPGTCRIRQSSDHAFCSSVLPRSEVAERFFKQLWWFQLIDGSGHLLERQLL
jgi:hypothetical protein